MTRQWHPCGDTLVAPDSNARASKRPARRARWSDSNKDRMGVRAAIRPPARRARDLALDEAAVDLLESVAWKRPAHRKGRAAQRTR